MKNRSKKFLIATEKDPTHIGNLVHWEIMQRHLKKKDVALQLGVIPTTLNQYFKQTSLQTIILWRLSQAVNFNFLMYLGQKLAIDFETEKEKQLKTQLAENEKQMESLQTQLSLFKQIHKIE
jgi:AraC-like DNA-binding protein